MKTWVKLYTDIASNDTTCDLSWTELGIWSAMLALCGEIDDHNDEGEPTGRLDTPANIAWHIRCTKDDMLGAAATLVSAGLVAIEADGTLRICDWKRYLSRSSWNSARELLREQLADDMNNRCAYCGRKLPNNWHIEHMQPKSRGGTWDKDNIVASCPRCNTEKATKTVDEYRAFCLRRAQDRGWLPRDWPVESYRFYMETEGTKRKAITTIADMPPKQRAELMEDLGYANMA